MQRDRLTPVAVALLSAVVVGLAAATLGETPPQRGERGVGDGNAGSLPGGYDPVAWELAPAPDLLWLVSAVLVLLAVLFLLGAVVFPRQTLKRTAIAVVATAVAIYAAWGLADLFGDAFGPRASEQAPPPTSTDGVAPSDGGGSGGVAEVVQEPVAVELLVVGVLGLIVLGVLVRQSRSPADTDSAGPEGSTLAAIGRSAGRAADRIADADAPLDNEVYRAWKEMTGHLDLEDPVARTPGEFRAAALDAGMARTDVEALTDLFREVRYGGVDPTEARETAAADALRRIEERYAAEEGSS